VIESLVDLTYRGISLGRRIKLAQIRPTSGYLELASPMPVGSEIAIITDDAVSFGVTVTWVHEQVAGADRTPGMIVAPRLASEPAAAWWHARVVLPDDDVARPTLPRTRPVTVRPRSHTQPTPPSQAPAEQLPTIIADLEARIAGANKPAPGSPPGPQVAPHTTVAPEAVASNVRTDEPDRVMNQTGDHAVIDDGHRTMIMDAIDPASLDLDPGTTAPNLPVAAAPPDGEAGPEDGSAASSDPSDTPPASGGKRRKRRTR